MSMSHAQAENECALRIGSRLMRACHYGRQGYGTLFAHKISEFRRSKIALVPPDNASHFDRERVDFRLYHSQMPAAAPETYGLKR